MLKKLAKYVLKEEITEVLKCVKYLQTLDFSNREKLKTEIVESIITSLK